MATTQGKAMSMANADFLGVMDSNNLSQKLTDAQMKNQMANRVPTNMYTGFQNPTNISWDKFTFTYKGYSQLKGAKISHGFEDQKLTQDQVVDNTALDFFKSVQQELKAAGVTVNIQITAVMKGEDKVWTVAIK